MKIQKKILSIALCSLISVGGSQLTLLKANAQEVARSSASNVQWEEDIKLELEDKKNPSCKNWCTLTLYNENGSIKLKQETHIPYNFKFADTFAFGICDNHHNGETKVRFRVTFDSSKPADQLLQEEITKFNDNPPKVGDAAYMHGLYYNDTFKFSDNNDILKRLCENSYTSRYSSKWDRGYRFGDDGLQEMIFRHTDVGVSLASKSYW